MGNREADGSGLALFAAELAAARAAAGFSQAELAGRIHYSESLVAMIEGRGHAAPLLAADGHRRIAADERLCACAAVHAPKFRS